MRLRCEQTIIAQHGSVGSCYICKNEKGFQQLAEVLKSDEMKQLKLLVYTKELFNELKDHHKGKLCHTDRTLEAILEDMKNRIVDFNNKNDRLEFVFDIAYEKCELLEYYHKENGAICKGRKHRLV